MKLRTIGMGLVAILALGAASAETPSSDNTVGWTFAGLKLSNPFDSSTWYDGAVDLHLHESETVTINPVDPDFWMSIADPKSHSVIHKGILNPASWAQFMRPSTYVNMMDPSIWVKWAKPETYSVLADPQTYVYRMQPGAFIHLMDVRSYSELVNPAAYDEILEAARKTVRVAYVRKVGKDLITSISE